MRKEFYFILLSFLFSGCSNIPSGITAVKNFNVNRYLGKWYEIVRLDHSFERNLSNVSAEYTLCEEGVINVLNRGFDEKKQKWKQIKGKAYFVKDKTLGQLKVTFFWPFYGGYNIIDLDKENYSYAMVCGPNRSYLWILARDKKLDPAVLEQLVKKADQLSFNINKLIYVKHDM